MLTKLDVSAQVALPDWARGRGLAVFLTFIFGATTADPRLPIKGASLGLLTHCGVSDGLRSSRLVVHHVVVALAKLLSLRSPFECVAPDWDQALA